jgi:hypothetical protein
MRMTLSTFKLGIFSFMRIAALFLFCILALTSLQSQSQAQTEAAFDTEYARRIQLEEIDGVYIPSDLDDAFAELNRLSDPSGIAKFRDSPEDTIRSKLHFGLGRWMIHNWGFYEGSRLSHYLKQLGLDHPDDMARFLIVSYHRHLNDVPLQVDEQVAAYRTIREEEIRERERRKEVIHEKTRIRKDKQ